MTTLQITLPELHPAQLSIAKHPSRFKVVCCGRRWGKGILGITLCIRKALKGGRCWWVAPVYQVALEGWAYLTKLAVRIQGAKILQGEHIVRFPGTGSIQIKTADNPDNLRGAGLDLVVLDEAATMKPDAWELALRPTLADRQGEAVFISTPQHFNWFYDLYERGQDKSIDEWASWQYPTWNNPFIPQEEIDAAQRDMLPEDFDQEFGASFTAVGGAVFRLLSANVATYLRPMPAGLAFARNGVGMDWGTTRQHKAAVVSGGRLTAGAVWITSGWQDYSGSSDVWRGEARRCRSDHNTTFARVDRSQSSELDRLKAPVLLGGAGYADVDKGNPNVEVRIAELGSLVISKNIFFDINGPGVRELYNRLCSYHRDKEGDIVEEEDDDVDACCYLVSELVRQGFGGDMRAQVQTLPTRARPTVAHKPAFRTGGGM